jgi:hypothetical protein
MILQMDTDRRSRNLTSKGAEYAAQLQAKKNATLARIQARKASTKLQPQIDELSSLFARVSVAQDDAEVDSLSAQLSRMGGRKRKTHKKNGKKIRKTRKH